MGGGVPSTGLLPSWQGEQLLAAPPEDLSRFIGPLSVTTIAPGEETIPERLLLNRCTLVQIVIDGAMSWLPRNGGWTPIAGPVIVGNQSRAVRIRLEAPVRVAGFAVHPAAWAAFAAKPATTFANRIVALKGGWADQLDAATREDDPATALERLIDAVRGHVMPHADKYAETASAFDEIVNSEPNMPVVEAAETIGLSPRMLERLARRHFGHTPKLVMRKSRLLMAIEETRRPLSPAFDRVSDLFYDASHQNRDFRLFLDRTPIAFARRERPLLSAGLVDMPARA